MEFQLDILICWSHLECRLSEVSAYLGTKIDMLLLSPTCCVCSQSIYASMQCRVMLWGNVVDDDKLLNEIRRACILRVKIPLCMVMKMGCQ